MKMRKISIALLVLLFLPKNLFAIKLYVSQYLWDVNCSETIYIDETQQFEIAPIFLEKYCAVNSSEANSTNCVYEVDCNFEILKFSCKLSNDE